MAESEETRDTKKTASLMISYSRKDKVFVKQLYDSLVARGFSPDDIWVDWEGIPLSADWMAEITKGIQSSNAFIFVISPESVASEVCKKEIEIAVESNKRFIPILHREPGKDAPLHEKISSHNWVFIRDDKELEKMLPALVDAINTDLTWIAQHTRLFNRAKEWDAKGRNDSYLVRGNDLQDAEAFISEGAAGKEPAPTKLHTEYVKASQAYAVKVRRRNQIIAAVVGVALLTLSIFALVQWGIAEQETVRANDNANTAVAEQVRADNNAATAKANEQIAIENEAIANENERAANSLALASEAINQKKSDTQLALMLGLLSIQETEQDGKVLPESKSALFSVLNSPNVLYTWQDEAIVSAAAYDPTGRYIAIGNTNGMGRLLDTKSRDLVYRIEMTTSINSLAFSPDGTRLAIATDDTAEVWNVQTGEKIYSLAGHDGYSIHCIEYSPDGNLIATGGEDWNVKIWNASNGSLKVTLPSHTDAVNSVDFSPDGTRLVSGSSDDTVILWDLENNDLLYKFRPDGFNTNEYEVYSVSFNPWGDRIISGGYKTVVIWDAFDYTEVSRLSGNRAQVYKAIFAPDGLSMLTASASVKIWDYYFGTERYNLSSHRGEVTSAAYSKDGNYLLTGSWDNTAKLWAANLLIENLKLDFGTPQNIDANYSSDGELIVMSDAIGDIYVANANTGALVAEWYTGVWTNQVAFDPTNSQRIVSGDDEGQVFIWEIGQDGPVVSIPTAHDGIINSTSFSPDGTMILTSGVDGIIRLWNAKDGTLLREMGNGEDVRNFVARFNYDGTQIVSGSVLVDTEKDTQEIVARIWDTQTGDPVTDLRGSTDVIIATVFSQDGNYVYAAGYDNIIRKWDAKSGNIVQVMTGHTGRVLDLDVSLDDSLLVSGSADTTVKVWDTNTGKEIFGYVGNNEDANSVAFSPDGKNVLTASDDETTKEFTIDYDRLIEIAQQYELRPLTIDECQRYLKWKEDCTLTLFGGAAPTNNDSSSTALPATPTPEAVEQPTEVVVESTPTPLPEPTQEPQDNKDSGQSSYVLDMNTVLDTWDVFMPTGVDNQVLAEVDGGSLHVQLSQYEDKLPRFYLVNSDFDYSNVRVELAATNYGNNSNGVILLCQVSDAGWYEFRISNAGLYTISAYSDSLQNFFQLANGGSPAIKVGKSQNVYAAECYGNELSLYINDTLAGTVTDASYKFLGGYAGFGVSSPDLLPVDVSIDSVIVTEE